MLKGRCHCGEIRYQVTGKPVYHALCHCKDCRLSAGAPMVGWALFANENLEVTGEPRVYASSEHGRRHFCGTCGTGLFYVNESVFPGQTDIQSATLEDPGAFPVQMQIQIADRIAWMEDAHSLPMFERYPAAP